MRTGLQPVSLAPRLIQTMRIKSNPQHQIDGFIFRCPILNLSHSLLACLRAFLSTPLLSWNTLIIICPPLIVHCSSLIVPLAQQACYCCRQWLQTLHVIRAPKMNRLQTTRQQVYLAAMVQNRPLPTITLLPLPLPHPHPHPPLTLTLLHSNVGYFFAIPTPLLLTTTLSILRYLFQMYQLILIQHPASLNTFYFSLELLQNHAHFLNHALPHYYRHYPLPLRPILPILPILPLLHLPLHQAETFLNLQTLPHHFNTPPALLL